MASAANRQPPSRGGSRATRLGSRRNVLLGATAIVVVAGVLATVLAGRSSNSSATTRTPASGRAALPVRTGASATSNPLFRPTSKEKRGGLPSWLPRPKVKTGRIVTATVAHPQYGIEGDTIRVVLAQGSSYVTAVGPEVPEEGHFPVPQTTPTTFVVTFAAASGPIPVNANAFTLLDETGMRHHPHVTAMNGGEPPATVPGGKPFSIKLHAILPTGGGRLIWTPEGGRQVASWDFDVEID